MNENITKEQMFFAVFCIENVARQLNLTGDAVYKMLVEDSGILDEYIISYYDTLHTQGKEYITDDIIEYMREKGVL